MAYITLNTAVALTGLSKRTLWRRIADGQLHAQGGADQGEHARVQLNDVVALSRLRLDPEDRALIVDADACKAEAQRIVERSKDVYRDVEGLAQTRAGRMRHVIESTFHLLSARAVVKAEEDLKLKGSKIHIA